MPRAHLALLLIHIAYTFLAQEATNLIIALVLVFGSATTSLASPLVGSGGGGIPSHHRRRYRPDGELPRLWIHSKLTAFAAEKPSFSPWSLAPERGAIKPSVLALLVNDSLQAEQAVAAAAASASAAGAEDKGRFKRTAPRTGSGAAASAVDDDGDPSVAPRRGVKVSVCDSISDWVQMTEAENMWGVRVNLSQSINVGGQVLNQYFYETFCRYDDERPCRGIDASLYTSSCENKYMWAYARVETRTQAEEWTLIKVRGSCSCALYRRPFPELAVSVWDDLRRR